MPNDQKLSDALFEDVLSLSLDPKDKCYHWLLHLKDKATSIQSLLSNDDKNNEKQYSTLLGVIHFVMSSTKNTHYIGYPKIYTDLQNILKPNMPDQKEDASAFFWKQLENILDYYDFVAKNNLKLNDDDKKKLLLQLSTVIAATLKSMPQESLQILNATPTKTAMTDHMGGLQTEYKTKKKEEPQFYGYKLPSSLQFMQPTTNPDRLHYIQLIAAMASFRFSNNQANDKDIPEEIRDREWCAKIGMLQFMGEDIENEYRFGGAEKSELYRIIHQLNLPQDKAMILTCLATFKYCLSLNDFREHVAKFGQTHFSDDNHLTDVDVRFEKLLEKINKMLAPLRNDPSLANHSTRHLFKRGGAWLGGLFFYPFGAFTGYTLGSADQFGVVPSVYKTTFSMFSRAIYGPSSSGPSYNMMTANLTGLMALGNAFGQLASIIGEYLGGGIGFILGLFVEGTFAGFQYLGRAALDAHRNEQIHLSEAHRAKIECLLRIPESVFSLDNKNKIAKNYGKELDESINCNNTQDEAPEKQQIRFA